MIDLNIFNSEAKLHHIGLVVSSIDNIINIQTHIDKIQDVKVAFLSLNGVPIELIEPTSGDSPVTKSLAKGNILVHICYEVNDIDTALSHSNTMGFRCISDKKPAEAFGGRLIAWVYNENFGLFELLERGTQ